MSTDKKTYCLKSKVAAIFMSLALLWLTVSLPFVYSAEQAIETYGWADGADHNFPYSENYNPFGHTTEEKAESETGSLSEYLHHIHHLVHSAGSLHKHDCAHSYSVYVAFHGEILCPPPNLILS